MREPAAYTDRREAGLALAEELHLIAGGQDTLVLALPRGGVPVAFEVARSLGSPLDLIVVRKLGVPWHPELAMGAVASGKVRVLNHEVIHSLGISPEVIEQVTGHETHEMLRCERSYRGDRSPPEIAGKCVILVDDGLATGSTMHAAVKAVRRHNPSRVIVAVPVAPPATVQEFADEVDAVVCLLTPTPFAAVGQWYLDFGQVSDEQVRRMLHESWQWSPAPPQTHSSAPGRISRWPI